jgi:hypothetical protein
MPSNLLSASTQGIGNPGYCVLSFTGTSPSIPNYSVSFIPTICHVVNIQYAPIQKINMAVGGQVHVWQPSTAEPISFPVAFDGLPWNQDIFSSTGRATDGYQDLLSFVRYTLNYHANTFTLMTPDGQIETCRYIKGIETFTEAQGISPKQRFYSGQLDFIRVIT